MSQHNGNRRCAAFSLPALIILSTCALIITGCGSAYRGEIRQMTRAEDWDGAAAQLRQTIEHDPDDAWAWRYLGRAYINLGEYEEARQALEHSDTLLPDHGETFFFLGTCHDGLTNTGRAVEYYTLAANSPDISYEARNRIRSRAYTLKRKLYRERAAALLASESYALEENAVAVYDFEISDADRASSGVGRALASLIIADLQQIPTLTLVERLELRAVLAEIERAQTNRKDIDAGKIVGAEKSVTGNILMLGDQGLEVAHYVLRNDDGTLLGDGTLDGDLPGLMALEKDIVWQVIADLGVEVTAEQRAAIGVRATNSLPAFLAYAQGIVLEDEEDYEGAYRLYREALSLDPNFAAAQLRAEETGNMSDVGGDALGAATSIQGAGLAAQSTAGIVFQRHASQVQSGAVVLDSGEDGAQNPTTTVQTSDPPRVEIPPVSDAATVIVDVTVP